MLVIERHQMNLKLLASFRQNLSMCIFRLGILSLGIQL